MVDADGSCFNVVSEFVEPFAPALVDTAGLCFNVVSVNGLNPSALSAAQPPSRNALRSTALLER
jgi:hypothetical protein